MIERLAEREKHLQYTPKNKKTKGGDYSSYHRHWNKSVNKWVGHRVCLVRIFFKMFKKFVVSWTEMGTIAY
jgi:hypothetical protein